MTLRGRRITDTGLSNLSGLPLQFLSIIGSELVRGSGLANLRGMPLAQIILGLPNFQEEYIAHLVGLPLQQLDLHECGEIGELGIFYLSRMKLIRLDLGRLNFNGRGLDNLITLPLHRLWFSLSPHVDDQLLTCLSRMCYVHTLWLCYCDKITDEGLKNIKPLKLESLDLRHCRTITNTGLKHLTTHSLRSLILAGCTSITDEGLSVLSGMQLEHLDLSGSSVTDAGISFIQSSLLESFDVCDCVRLTDEFMRCVSNFPKLRRLLVGGCTKITDQGVEYLAKTSIEKLLLNDTSITDACLLSVMNMHALRELCLEGCNITNENLHRLSSVRGIVLTDWVE